MLCISCNSSISEESDFCSNCGFEYNNNVNNDASNDSSLDNFLEQEKLKYDTTLRMGPTNSTLCYDEDGNFVLVKKCDEQQINRFKQMIEKMSDSFPRYRIISNYICFEWNIAWITLGEWISTDKAYLEKEKVWRKLVEFTQQCHTNGFLVNILNIDTIWINTETNYPVFEAIEFMTFETEKQIIVCNSYFSSPEVKSGYWDNVSFQSDIYMLGKLWLNLLNDIDISELKNFNENLPIENPNRGKCFSIRRALLENIEDRWKSIDDMMRYYDDSIRSFSLLPYGFTEQGFRELNEDGMFIYTINESHNTGKISYGVFIVTDGMGGLDCGEYASSFCIKFLSTTLVEKVNHIISLETPIVDEQVIGLLGNSINLCNLELLKKSQEQNKKFGTTVVAVIIFDNACYMGYVGDSRFYHFDTTNKIKFVSEDHSLVAKRVAEGDLTEEEAMINPDKNIVYQALGLKEIVRVDKYIGKIQPGEKVILCTDGICGVFTNRLLEEILNSENDIERLSNKLFYSALDRGSTDNCTLIIVKGE